MPNYNKQRGFRQWKETGLKIYTQNYVITS